MSQYKAIASLLIALAALILEDITLVLISL